MFWAHATPPTRTLSRENVWNDFGTSMREENLIGASAAYPRVVQYALKSENFVTSMSTSHLVAET